MEIRPEAPEDHAAIRAVNTAAFETPAEADLVEALRLRARPFLSLVAEDEGEVVGHICFSPATAEEAPRGKILGLAPMAVLPAHQRRGVGSQLVRAGLARCKGLGYSAVIVLGHPGYYPRFGFVPASRFGISSIYDVPDEVFMALELEAESLQGISGKVRYHAAFGDL